jgi:hypothetical protein
MNTSPVSNTGHPEARPRLNRIPPVWIIATVGILICGVCLFFRTRDTRPSLPDAADIRSLNASFYDREKNAKVEFEVPREHWNAIYSALQPAQRDGNPAKWAGMGELEFKLASGDSYLVSLYSLDDSEPGAFSAGPTFESRVYYRGGNSSDLERALADASKSADGKPSSATD